MLKPWQYAPPTELDELFFRTLVPADHSLRRVKDALDFYRLRPLLAEAYPCPTGRPAAEPLLLLKLEYLQYHYNLSDRKVLEQAQVNIAYRFFLDLSLDSGLPHPSLLSYFRDRLGPHKHQQVFDAVLVQAREHGLVKDRLRLKDATHVIANIAIPSTLRLLAQTRDHLLAAAQAFLPDWVAEHHQVAQTIRTATADLDDPERLLQRVAHLRPLVARLDLLVEGWGPAVTDETPPRGRLRQARALAHKVLADRDDPEGSDRVVSIHDPEARTSRHGDWYTGYLLDVTVDADSELITALDVLPANGAEGADATALIEHEERRHGNDVAALSIDGAGFRGELLRAWTDPQRLSLEVIVPPSAAKVVGFGVEAFVLEDDGRTLRCPAGQTTRQRDRNTEDTGWKYRFGAKTCTGCPRRAECLRHPARPGGRTVTKNDYEAEYKAARAKAQTEAYQRVRSEHPKVERKLGELVRWHGGRRARSRGRPRLRLQGFLTGLVVNIKRLVRLLLVPGAASGGTVRAELVATG